MNRHYALSLAAVVAAGLACKLYRGPGAWWLNDSLAGLFYVVFWCLAAAALLPRARAAGIAFWVLAVTCLLEILQLWHPPFLQQVRRTFVGQALIGTTFQATDFVYYLIGAGIGWYWTRRMREVGMGGGVPPCHKGGSRGDQTAE